MSTSEFITQAQKKIPEIAQDRAQLIMEINTLVTLLVVNPLMENPTHCQLLLEKTKSLCQVDTFLTWLKLLLEQAKEQNTETPSNSLDFPLKKP